MEQLKSVLILGGSGQAGADTATLLRRWYPGLPLTIAGRDLARARRVADELDAADAVTIDLRRGDLGLPGGRSHSAVVAALRDSRLSGLRYAQDHGLPYLSISSGLIELAPEVIAGAQRATAAPILLASHCLAGLIVLAALDAAREFDRVETVRMAAVLDEQDAGGPAAIEDMERLMAISTAGLIRRDGVFTWVSGAAAEVEVACADGVVLPGQRVAIPDVPSVALATGALNVHFDLAAGETASRRRGEPASIEFRIDIEGTGASGTPLSTSRHLVHPGGQRPLTALGIVLGVERLLGLRGEPAAPGIHTPEALIDPTLATKRMAEIGTIPINT
ncbi:saccharopine dehydrogenase [Spongiactinospora gelatinilytica]|uniref:Saccharopine dehydrogenase n=1 Tax=Spongiactinospora gelatinilytica TaxID=2666298 RepID=A0A2W2FXD0_9ACTN|nr:saccharopine dehydrogenase [Spongiactinospora gelatinilytica]PZG26517.1 saccharopine dehydrogenase [Spongiactinospora gelatinilytica]